jgi:neutral ceramidase
MPQEFMRLARAMVAGEAVPPGPAPPNLLSRQWSLVPPVVADGVPDGKAFGDVSQDVPPGSFQAGDTVEAVFHAGCPRNNIRAEGTFLAGGGMASLAGLPCKAAGLAGGPPCPEASGGARTRCPAVRARSSAALTPSCRPAMPRPAAVERREADGSWATVHTDADWSTRFSWGRPHALSELSYATVSWEVPRGTPAGTYCLRHYGDYKPWFGRWELKGRGQAGDSVESKE